MEENFEDIVRKWYVKLRGNFTTLLMDRYSNSSLTLADAENIYQDIFLAIHKNLREGRLRKDTAWESYIMRIGLNMAGKKYRKARLNESIEKSTREISDSPSAKEKRITDILRQLPSADDEDDIHSDPEAQSLLGDQLSHTPEPCASIIRMTYYDNLSDKEIALILPGYKDNGKSVEVNAKAIRARRWLCMNDLIYRVKLSLFNAGYIDKKPIKFRRNGKTG